MYSITVIFALCCLLSLNDNLYTEATSVASKGSVSGGYNDIQNKQNHQSLISESHNVGDKNGQSSKVSIPLTVPHRTSNDPADPCKAGNIISI